MDTSQKKENSLRKISKQEMERRRRARMNVSLDKLKSIMQKVGFIDDSDGMKMEKAEILDRVVEFCDQIVDRKIYNQKKHFKIIPSNIGHINTVKSETNILLTNQTKPTNSMPEFTDRTKFVQRMPLSTLNPNQMNIIEFPQTVEKRVFNPKFTADLNRYWSSQKKIWKPYE